MKLFAILLLGVAALFGQDSQISGRITDSSHAVVPNANVTALNTENGLKRTVQSNHEGYYTVPLLPPGVYAITVRMAGFQTAERDKVELQVEQDARIDFSLEMGRSEQVVNVTADAPLMQTDPSVGTVINRQFVENLPLNGRSFQSLLALTPGAVATSSSSGTGQFSFNGQRSDANYWMIDGVSSNIGGGNGLGSQGAAGGGSGVQVSAAGGFNNMVSVDALEEFKIETSTFAPEHGRLPGGQISIVTRSGSNSFHGAASDYVRNTLFDANNWLNDANRIAKPPEHHNDFGGVVGGAIVKNKVFFFFSYEGQRLAVPTSIANVSVPSVAARQRAVPALQPILNAFPLPNVPQCVTGTTGCDPNVGLFNTSYSNKVNLDATALRLDWQISSKMTLFARGDDAPSSGVSRNSPPSAYNVTSFGLKTLTVGHTYILSPTMTSDLRFNYTYAPSTSRGLLDNFGGAVPVPDSILYNVPGFNATNSSWNWGGRLIGSIGVSATGNAHATQYNVIENYSWIHGKHQMKFGVDFRKIEPYAASALYSQGYSYGLTTDSWVTNVPSQYNTSTMQPKDFWYYQTGFYGQDSFKVTSRLTLTYGLRWDVNPPPGAPQGQHLQALSAVNANSPATTHILPDGTPIYQTEWNALAPRFGFAYQLSNSQRWGRVLRGGYGLFFDTGGVAAGAAVLQFSTVIFPNPPAFPVPASYTIPPIPVSSPPWGFVSTVDPKFRLPYTHQWNVAIEQALGSLQSLSITYAAALGRNLARRELYPSDAEFPQDFMR